jgi:uncharacterized protein
MNENLEVIHNQSQKRFEIQLDSHLAELTYYLQGDTIIFTHTGVPPALEGRGIGSLLVKAGLQYAADNKLKVRSQCWFVDKYIQRHPESLQS